MTLVEIIRDVTYGVVVALALIGPGTINMDIQHTHVQLDDSAHRPLIKRVEDFGGYHETN